jgi:CO dehydrogenase/acetyl-CoA synthase alpha subunit
MTYEEKQMAKLEKYQELADKNAKGSVSSWESSNKMLECIPFGQPILVGHHSEKAHRRLIARSWSAMDKSVEMSNKAEYYKNKVENILNPRAISSDDENAVDKLNEKLKDLEAKREKYKEFNKKARKEKTDSLPSYMLSNLSQNIASVKKRIEYLGRLAKVEEKEWTFGENTVKIDKEDNRVKIFFPGKPSEEIRTELKSNGFRWSPYNSAWQRQISRWAIDIAKKIAGEIK